MIRLISIAVLLWGCGGAEPTKSLEKVAEGVCNRAEPMGNGLPVHIVLDGVRFDCAASEVDSLGPAPTVIACPEALGYAEQYVYTVDVYVNGAWRCGSKLF